jgi:hypothetical protein
MKRLKTGVANHVLSTCGAELAPADGISKPVCFWHVAPRTCTTARPQLAHRDKSSSSRAGLLSKAEPT